MKRFHLLSILALACAGCAREYGDRAFSREASDILLGLKVAPSVLFSATSGTRDFCGFFVSQYPETEQAFFDAPPDTFFTQPTPMSYEKDMVMVLWRPTPVDETHLSLLGSADTTLEFLEVPDDLRHALYEAALNPGHFYALKFRDHGERQSNLTMWVLDTGSRIVYKMTDTGVVSLTSGGTVRR